MRVLCDSLDLSAALGVVTRAAASRTSLPVLGTVLLEATPDGLRLSATNLELSIRRTVPADVAVEGAVAVPGRLLADFAAALPREVVRLDLEQPGSRLRLESDSFSTEINGIPADEFPPLGEITGGSSLALPVRRLVDAIADTAVASSTDEARPVLTGIRLEVEGAGLTLTAIDGHRLAVRRVDLGPAAPAEGRLQLTVPARTMAEVARLLRGADGDVEVRVDPQGSLVVFRVPGTEVASRVIDGAYPDHRRLVPDGSATTVTVSAADLGARLRALAPFAQTSANVVRLTVSRHSIGLSAATVDVGSARTELEAAVEGSETTVAFNARYLLDCPALGTDDRVELHLQGPLGPFVVRRPTSDEYVSTCSCRCATRASWAPAPRPPPERRTFDPVA